MLVLDGEAQFVKEFERPNSDIRILVSVAALAKGFDVPDVGCIIDARPLRRSLSEAIQMWGRGLRCSPGKNDCLLLDHSGNAVRFLEDFEDIYFNGFKSLDDGEKADRKIRKEEEDYVPKGCPQCGSKPFRRRCLACGFERARQARTMEEAGVMQEIRLGNGKKAADDSYHCWCQIVGYVRNSKSQRKQAYAKALYHNITGDWPRSDWQVDFTEPARLTQIMQRELKRQRIAYVRAQEKRGA